MAKQKRRRPGPGGPGRPQLKPHWQPIEALAMIAAHIDGMLQADREQYETLLEAKPKPHVLDDDTIDRVIAAFTTQRNDFGLFDEQLQRWAALPLSGQQRREVERLSEQMRLLRENNEKVLTLARELSTGTIDKVMAKSDVELGLEMLRKGWPKR
jgi:ribosomal protein L16 Arg81 hydroxylase